MVLNLSLLQPSLRQPTPSYDSVRAVMAVGPRVQLDPTMFRAPTLRCWLLSRQLKAFVPVYASRAPLGKPVIQA